MKLYEYQGKELFRKYGLPTPAGVVAKTAAQVQEHLTALTFPAMVKAQILSGGRGKAGGVKRAKCAEEAKNYSKDLLGAQLKDLSIDAVLLEECVSFVHEYYLSITLDSRTRMPIIIFSAHGGVDIEEVAAKNPEHIAKVLIDPLIGLQDFYLVSLLKKANVTDAKLEERLREVIRALYALYNDYDCMLVEINPLMQLTDGSLLAADAKVEVDDSGIYRHSDLAAWQKEMRVSELVREARDLHCVYIDISEKGTVGVTSNGSGMVMACVDGISRHGGQAACALDLGGGAPCDRVAAGLTLLAKNPHVKVILLSVFGGITRCDEVANGILKALNESKITVPIVAKLDGTNQKEGLDLLLAANRPEVLIGYNVKEASEKALQAQGGVK